MAGACCNWRHRVCFWWNCSQRHFIPYYSSHYCLCHLHPLTYSPLPPPWLTDWLPAHPMQPPSVVGFSCCSCNCCILLGHSWAIDFIQTRRWCHSRSLDKIPTTATETTTTRLLWWHDLWGTMQLLSAVGKNTAGPLGPCLTWTANWLLIMYPETLDR